MSSNRRASPVVPATMMSTFRVDKPSSARGRRAKYAPKRRQEVKLMREKRACLRCSLLRIPCSHDGICTPCEKLALAAYEKRTLSFSACIRTRLVEVSVFEDLIPSSDIRSSVIGKSRILALSSITLDFSSQIKWDLTNLTLELVEWLNNPELSTTSKVGILSSPKFLELVGSYISDEISVNFQRMLYAESLAYTQPTANDKHPLSVPELQQIGAIAGHNILVFLDRKLKPESLRTCSKRHLEALFLLVIGTILATTYAYPALKGNTTLDETTQSKYPGYYLQFQAMQNHLCQILAHYVVFLGSKLGLFPVASHTENFILEAATSRWHKEGLFLWSTISEYDPETDRSFKINDYFHEGIITNFNVDTITPTKLSKLSIQKSAYNSNQGQNAPDLKFAWSDLFSEHMSPSHHQENDVLSPKEEIRRKRYFPKQGYLSHRQGHIRRLSGCCKFLASCSSGVTIGSNWKDNTNDMVLTLSGRVAKAAVTLNPWTHLQPQYKELGYQSFRAPLRDEAEFSTQGGYWCQYQMRKLERVCGQDMCRSYALFSRCDHMITCQQCGLSYDGDVSIGRGHQYPASRPTEKGKEKESSANSGLSAFLGFAHEHLDAYGIGMNIELPEYQDYSSGLCSGLCNRSQNFWDNLNVGAVFEKRVGWTCGPAQVEAVPAVDSAFLELCSSCSGNYMNGWCNTCGEAQWFDRSLSQKGLKQRQNLLV